MAGTGSFERENRTLHISRIGQYQGDVGTVVRSHFGKFGKILAVKVLLDKGMAFVKFACRLNAEFAKEAMNEQALDKDEVLSVRWSVEDLNVGLGDDSREEAQRELAKKLLEDPNRLHTMRLLHDTQSERDLNAYYQQQDLNYSQYQYQHQWAKTTGQEVDSGQVDLNKYYQANPYAYYYQYAQASAQKETKEKPVLAITAPKKAAPPPPPKKDKDASNKKRANEDVSEGEERKIRKN
jgi:RNA recognition motif-containing protein